MLSSDQFSESSHAGFAMIGRLLGTKQDATFNDCKKVSSAVCGINHNVSQTKFAHSMTPEQPQSRARGAQTTQALAVPADKDSLRALFHLFVGKPDSTVKVLPRAVQITPACIADLHEQVREKLRNHHIEALVASADLSFEDKTTIQFGGWTEFEAFRWTTPKTTREVRLKWQFLLSVQGYEMPQQHALTVKLCADARPLEVLQAMLSKHPADEDESVVNFAPTTARVDFISNSLANELLAVVENWNSGLKRPQARSDLMSKLDNKKELIAALIDYSTPVLVALASIGLLRYLFLGQQTPNQALSLATATGMMQWLMPESVTSNSPFPQCRWNCPGESQLPA
jgi:hypothetical protein